MLEIITLSGIPFNSIKKSLFLLFLVTNCTLTAQLNISLNPSPALLNQPITDHALTDFQQLLALACNCPLKQDDQKAAIQINFSEPTQVPFSGITNTIKDGIPYFDYPDTDFQWQSSKNGDQITLVLSSASFEGMASGLYALLQEKLGFRFYHPRETVTPILDDWPLPGDWSWEVHPQFTKRGFHIHTMHPLELTEPLLDEHYPKGQEIIREYINWLARNGQNFFEFNLLNSVTLDSWLPYAKEFVDYGHERGIIMGLDISLNMIQQKAYQLYVRKPKSFKSKEKQVISNLNRLKTAGFDLFNIELSSTEYTSGNSTKRYQLVDKVMEWARENDKKIMGRAHIVKKGDAVLNYSGAPAKTKDSDRGVMIHTVMFYGLHEDKAPCYGNDNLKHMHQLMKKEQEQRETWYFPESAYWVSFDNSVPMTLLPYLSSRHKDIELVTREQIDGHLTFSSGWEWGYWLFDWSIARWSWDYEKASHPTDAIHLLFEGEGIQQSLQQLHDLQDHYFKEKELIRYLAAQSVMDEVPKSLSREFQPRPHWRYDYLFRKASKKELEGLNNKAIEPLGKFISEYSKGLEAFRQEIKQLEISLIDTIISFHPDTYEEKMKVVRNDNAETPLLKELYDGLEITLLRAKHRKACLEAIMARRLSRIEGRKSDKSYLDILKIATEARTEALEIVRKREAEYRYDQEELTTKRKGHTAYHFGYLYPVHELHFWEREEGQIKENKWGFLYDNIWNIGRIIGIKK